MKNKQLDSYKKNGHLINKKIQCTLCSSDVTMFGSNLDNRIIKFGSIELLLETFICRSCVSASKPKKEKKVSVRLIKRKEKEAKKVQTVPKLKPYVSREVYLKDTPDLVSEMTKNGSCIRPDIYLNDGCYKCPYAQSCNASCNSWTSLHVTA